METGQVGSLGLTDINYYIYKKIKVSLYSTEKYSLHPIKKKHYGKEHEKQYIYMYK